MALTTVSELRSTLGVGTLYPDSTLQEVCDATDAVLLPMLWANNSFLVGYSNTANTGTSYFNEYVADIFYVGQTVTIAGSGSKHNGNKTITGVGEKSITYAITGNNNTPTVKHDVVPYGYAYGDTYTDYETLDEVREASLMIAVDIWQARQTSSAGGISPDFQPSPYRMGNTLMARVRGLLADHLAPGGQVG